MNYINTYVKFLNKFLQPARPIKIVFDCSNGTTGIVLKNLKTEKLKTILINQNPDGNFPGHGPNPLNSGAMNQLKKEVIKRKANLGAIFDADGDRVFFIDEKGKMVSSDTIGQLLIWHLKPQKIIVNVINGWLIKRIDDSKLKIIESRVGHYFIKKAMKENNADLGIEHSGHYYFKKLFYLDSGILTAIEIINAVSKLPYKLSDFTAMLPQYCKLEETNFKVENSKAVINRIENYYRKERPLKVSHLDGLTIEFADYWFNVRPSNTEPLLRLNLEASSKKLFNAKTKELTKLISF